LTTIFPDGPKSSITWGFNESHSKVFANNSSYKPSSSAFSSLSTVKSLFVNKNKEVSTYYKSKFTITSLDSPDSLCEYNVFGTVYEFDFKKFVPFIGFLKFVFICLPFVVVLRMRVKRGRPNYD